MTPQDPNCKAFHAAKTCERLDPLAFGSVSVLAIMHNHTHGYDKAFPMNMGETVRQVAINNECERLVG